MFQISLAYYWLVELCIAIMIYFEIWLTVCMCQMILQIMLISGITFMNMHVWTNAMKYNIISLRYNMYWLVDLVVRIVKYWLFDFMTCWCLTLNNVNPTWLMFCVCKVNKYSETEVFVFKHVVFVFASLLCMRIIYIHRNLGFYTLVSLCLA